MAGLLNIVTSTYNPMDAGEAEESLKKGDETVLQADEKVDMAFACGRDRVVFTSKRMIKIDRQGLTGKRTSFDSIPYKAVKAFAVESAGTIMDNNSELVFWTDMAGMPYVKLNLSKSSVSIFDIHNYVMAKVLKGPDERMSTTTPGLEPAKLAGPTSTAGLACWLTDDARQVNAEAMEQTYSKEIPVLNEGERVFLAFKSGRDSLLLTDRRYIKIDVQGITGTKQEYLSVPYSSIHAFAIRTAGGFLDGDAELTIWTGLPTITGMYEIQQDLRKGAADLFAVQQFLAGRVLGAKSAPPAHLAAGSAEGRQETSGSFLDWLGGDVSTANPSQAEAMLRSTPTSLLLPEERVDLAYRLRNDWWIFTSLRIILVDKMKVMMGLGGSKVEYLSLLYSSIGGFGVQSAGSWDRDAELYIWTDIYHPPPPPSDDNPPPPPPPGMSFLTQDLRAAHVDIFSLSKLLTERVLGVQLGMMTSAPGGVGPTGGALDGGVMSLIGGDARQMDPREVENRLRASVPLLGADEHLTLALRCGRDLLAFSPLRAIIVDVSGWSGKRVEYRTIAFKAMRGFSVETAGTIDTDADFKILTALPWMSSIKQDIRKGAGNVYEIQKLVAHVLLPSGVEPQAQSASEASKSKKTGGMLSGAMAVLGSNSKQVDPAEMQTRLSSAETPILQSGEVVHLAFQCGRDSIAFTQLRVIRIDVQGLTGAKIEYMSLPWSHMHAFGVTVAHNIDHHVKLYSDTAAASVIAFDLLKGSADVFEVQQSIAKLVLR